jgi:hypothetical protein
MSIEINSAEQLKIVIAEKEKIRQKHQDLEAIERSLTEAIFHYSVAHYMKDWLRGTTWEYQIFMDDITLFIKDSDLPKECVQRFIDGYRYGINSVLDRVTDIDVNSELVTLYFESNQDLISFTKMYEIKVNSESLQELIDESRQELVHYEEVKAALDNVK